MTNLMDRREVLGATSLAAGNLFARQRGSGS